MFSANSLPISIYQVRVSQYTTTDAIVGRPRHASGVRGVQDRVEKVHGEKEESRGRRAGACEVGCCVGNDEAQLVLHPLK